MVTKPDILDRTRVAWLDGRALIRRPIRLVATLLRKGPATRSGGPEQEHRSREQQR